MATFVRNCYPDVLEICKVFDHPWRKLIQKVDMPEVELREWGSAIDGKAREFETALSKMKDELEAPNPWVNIPECSNEDIITLMAGFMKE